MLCSWQVQNFVLLFRVYALGVANCQILQSKSNKDELFNIDMSTGQRKHVSEPWQGGPHCSTMTKTNVVNGSTHHEALVVQLVLEPPMGIWEAMGWIRIRDFFFVPCSCYC